MTDAPPLRRYLDRQLTGTQKRYLAWLQEKTGYQVTDLTGFMLAVALRDQFQKSPENKAWVGQRKREIAAAREAEEKIRRLARNRAAIDEARVAAAAGEARAIAAGGAGEDAPDESGPDDDLFDEVPAAGARRPAVSVPF